MKFNFVISSCLLFLLCLSSSVLVVKADLEFQVYNEDSLTMYPKSTDGNKCSYQVLTWIIPQNGESITYVNISSFEAYNATHYLYKILFDEVPIGNQVPNGFYAEDSNFVKHEHTLYLNCKSLDDNMDIQVIGKIMNDPVFGYSLLVNTTGIPSYTSLAMKISDIPLSQYIGGSYGTFRLMSIPYSSFSLSSSITGPVQISLYTPNSIKSYTIQNYFDDYYDQDLLVNFYPSEIENQITLFGAKSYPYFTIQANTSTSKKDPLFSLLVFSTVDISSRFIPIGISNGITTYFASFPFAAPFSLYAQDHNIRTKVFEKTINILDVPTTIYSQSDVTLDYMAGDMFLNIGISSQESYKLNNIKFGTGTITRNVGAPYGFTHSGGGGDNSNYAIHMSVPVSGYYKDIPFQIFDSQTFYYEVTNNNNPYPSEPVFTSYEFIYLTNSKYILNINIVSSDCGIGFISFNSVDYKRISQYRVSGDSFNGVYQIPIDFDFDLAFHFVSLYDLCGRMAQFYDGSFIRHLPFQKFQVPFLNYNTDSIFSITNITYLYNNLDVRNQSIGNIMYFNIVGVDPKAPLSFRLPVMDSIGTSGFFIREYFAVWNSSVEKFQVEFVVPLNSRPGAFRYSITNGINSYVPSDFLPDSDQLIISKSNFDALGPIFSKVERIPFSTVSDGSGSFGWRLTISDPINGFDNGTITVMGSQDNSIYKFNLLPIDATSGDSKEGVYEIIIKTTPLLCVNQDYIITYVKLWDTGAQYSTFEFTLPFPNHNPNQLANPFNLFVGNSSINKYPISCNDPRDLSGPTLSKMVLSKESIDVGIIDRTISVTLQVEDYNGINIYAQGPIVYFTAEGFDIVECFSVLLNFTANTFESAYYECSVELPVGFGENLQVFTISVHNILNNHGVFNGYSSDMLKSYSFPYKVLLSYSLDQPLLLETGVASSRGGQYFVFGRVLADIDSLTTIDTVSHKVTNYTISSAQKYGLSSVVSISNLAPTTNDFYVMVTSKSGIASNRLLVSPVLFNDYTPSQDSSSGDQEPLPTNAPQQCYGNPICGGPTHGTCNNQTGCVCIYPWRGKSCQDKVSEPSKPPIVDPNQPSTGIEIPDDKDDQGNPINNIHYQSLVSLHSLREIDINGKAIKNYIFYNKWAFNQYSDLKSNYQINVTTGTNGFNTTISTTLEWFNQTKVITFADQDLEMYANSIKYSIEISNYPFSSSLTYLQLVMSATITSTSSDSCSSKDFGETTSGDNSNYINIQIDNKSLYGRFIKRGIIDEGQVVSLSNERLDSALNAVSKASQTQTYIGITIPQYQKRALIDPDFSILISSNSATSVCKSKGLSGAKIAGIVIGATAFAAVIAISIVYYFKKKNDAQKFKTNISNKLSQMNSTSTA